MFQIDTGSEGGSRGPWISWTSEGSARKGLRPETWVLREKHEGAAEASFTEIPAFLSGCVMDLDTLKLGWEKDGAKGTAPERRWNASIAKFEPRPSEDKRPGGGFVWGKALSVRLAIGGGKSATWEQASHGAFEAFTALSKMIQDQWQAHSQNGRLLPLIKQTSVERRQLPNGNTSVPVLTVAGWVERPECLKADAPVIATADGLDPVTLQARPAPAPAVPAPAAPAPAASSAVPADAGF